MPVEDLWTLRALLCATIVVVGCSDGAGTNSPCGNGRIDSGESCDDGTENSDTVADRCRSSCTPPACGDGIVDSGEECDNGVGNSDVLVDHCRSNCNAPSCGDGVVDSNEVCDDGDGGSCGDCGATCLEGGDGSSCTPGLACIAAGTCVDLVTRKAKLYGLRIAATNTELYFGGLTDINGEAAQLMRMPLDADTPTVIADDLHGPISNLIYSSGWLFWGTTTGGQVQYADTTRYPISSHTLLATPDCFAWPAVEGGYLYWSTCNSVWRVKIGIFSAAEEVANGVNVFSGLAVGDSTLFWRNWDGIYSAPTGLPTQASLLIEPTYLFGTIRWFAGKLFWDSDNLVSWAETTESGLVARVDVDTGDYVAAFTVDHTGVYVANNRSLKHIDVDTGAQTLLSEQLSLSGGPVATNDTHVFAGEISAGAIVRAEKP